ncbi:MAG: dUTP diphosphatase [Clostridiales bacterium]|nr:dUTP diphosphatase [Clostridiales bacterium]
MENYTIRVLRLRADATMPRKAHEDDAGYDLYACAETLIPAGESRLIPTGIALGLPPMTEAQIRPRSGLALNHQITVLNTPGTIDSGYRGEIGVILINHGQRGFLVEKGMKIAQMVVAPVLPTQLLEAESLDTTERGSGGFGSTDRS